MRFADADVVALGNIPPLEVRLDLQPGDRVGLYEEVRHPSMGSGYSPVEAVVMGSTEPGWFVGETEDGRQVTFHAGNVADIEMSSPSMGGILDWFKKMAPPSPGAMIPSEQARPQLPALPAPPEERKGIIAQLKNIFAAPFSGLPEQASPVAQKTSIFDVFRRPQAPKSGLPVEREEYGVVPSVKAPSMFSVLDPGSKVIVPFVEKAASIVLPEGPGPLAPIIEKALQPFMVIPKSAELEPYELRKAKQQEFWAEMFPKAEEGAPPLSAMFTMFPQEELQPREEVIPPKIPARMHRHIKILPMGRRSTLLPSVEDVARGFMGFYTPLEDLWDTLREVRNNPRWTQYVERYGFAKEPFESLGTCGGPPDIFQELSSFLHIPWEEFRARAEVVEHGEDEEEWVDEERVWMEIVFPATELITQALDMMKPPDLPGHFTVERSPHDEGFCMLVINYVEGEEKEGAEEQWKEDQQKLQAYQEAQEGQPEQEERSLEEIAKSLEEGIKQEEETTIKLIEALENLSPNNKDFKAISEQLKANLEESKASLKALTEELSNLPIPEKSKRAPAGKKAAYRGGKKKGK